MQVGVGTDVVGVDLGAVGLLAPNPGTGWVAELGGVEVGPVELGRNDAALALGPCCRLACKGQHPDAAGEKQRHHQGKSQLSVFEHPRKVACDAVRVALSLVHFAFFSSKRTWCQALAGRALLRCGQPYAAAASVASPGGCNLATWRDLRCLSRAGTPS